MSFFFGGAPSNSFVARRLNDVAPYERYSALLCFFSNFSAFLTCLRDIFFPDPPYFLFDPMSGQVEALSEAERTNPPVF